MVRTRMLPITTRALQCLLGMWTLEAHAQSERWIVSLDAARNCSVVQAVDPPKVAPVAERHTKKGACTGAKMQFDPGNETKCRGYFRETVALCRSEGVELPSFAMRTFQPRFDFARAGQIKINVVGGAPADPNKFPATLKFE